MLIFSVSLAVGHIFSHSAQLCTDHYPPDYSQLSLTVIIVRYFWSVGDL